jgi:hypothetical protein
MARQGEGISAAASDPTSECRASFQQASRRSLTTSGRQRGSRCVIAAEGDESPDSRSRIKRQRREGGELEVKLMEPAIERLR